MERTLAEYVAETPVFVRKFDGEIVYWARGAEGLYGFPAAEALGRVSHDLLRTIFPTRLDDIEAQLVSEREWRGRLRHTTRDGREIWTESVWRLRDGNIVIEQNTDISERVDIERQREVLMLELDHRVKNTLAVVQSLARMTFQDVDKSLVRKFEQRIHALSQAHHVLTHGHLAGAPLRQVIAGVLGNLNIETRVTLDGPEAELQPKAVLSYTLAFHELCTNALKHGALSLPEGHVDVSWSVFDAERRIHLVWREIDGPPVVAPQTEGFGSRLIRNVVAAELGTPVDMRFEHSGLVCEFDGPLQKSPSV